MCIYSFSACIYDGILYNGYRTDRVQSAIGYGIGLRVSVFILCIYVCEQSVYNSLNNNVCVTFKKKKNNNEKSEEKNDFYSGERRKEKRNKNKGGGGVSSVVLLHGRYGKRKSDRGRFQKRHSKV